MRTRFLPEEQLEELNDTISALAEKLDPNGTTQKQFHNQRTGRTLPNYPTTQEEIHEYLRSKRIEDILFMFVDPHAKHPKTFSITARELDNAFRNGMGFDGSSIQGYRRIEESDMVAKPDPNSFTILPFPIAGRPIATMFADIYTPEGEPFLGDPRTLLKQTIKRFQESHDFTHINIGPEPEFYVLDENNQPVDAAGYFDAGGENLRTLIRNALETMGIQVEYHHHEVGPSQHEIDIKYDDAISMADKLIRFKYVTKTLTERLGLRATFMPKPIETENGSGMHTHISVFNGDKNLFFDKEDPYHFSTTGYQFMGGILAHAREIALVTNPLANSYKRLVPGFEAPVYLGWSRANRSCMIRITDYRRGKEEATRLEVRNPDPTANAYLYLAAIISAGFNGISNELSAGDPLNIDLYQLNEEERLKRNIDTLPADLGEAIIEARESELLPLALGTQLYHNLISEKQLEWSVVRREVTPRDFVHALGF